MVGPYFIFILPEFEILLKVALNTINQTDIIPELLDYSESEYTSVS